MMIGNIKSNAFLKVNPCTTVRPSFWRALSMCAVPTVHQNGLSWQTGRFVPAPAPQCVLMHTIARRLQGLQCRYMKRALLVINGHTLVHDVCACVCASVCVRVLLGGPGTVNLPNRIDTTQHTIDAALNDALKKGFVSFLMCGQINK